MRKTCLFITSLVLSVLFVVPLVHAATLTLDRIGVLDTSGSVYSEWWYTGTTPTLSGKAVADKTVTITVDGTAGTAGTAQASSGGDWSFYSDLLTSGDHTVLISSEGETLSFTLHVGQDLPADLGGTGTTVSTASVPDTGSTQLIMVMVSGVLITTGWYFWDRKRNVIPAFEEEITSDLN